MRRKLRGSLFPMSALGQKQTSEHNGIMSALPPKADIELRREMSALCQKRTHAPQQIEPYSITSSAIESKFSGTSMPSARAVCRLMANSNLVVCSTGRSAGLAPLRILPV